MYDIVVYDRILTKMEQKTINAFDCNCLSVNKNGKWKVDRPMLFFMPHCEFFVIDRVLEANWMLEHLNKVIVLRNSLGVMTCIKKILHTIIILTKPK